MTRGVFVSLDGIDGCGKSTQCRLLADWLRSRGHAVTACRDPGGTALGDEVRRLILDSSHPRSAAAEAMLFMTSRAQLVAEVIGPALIRGDAVVCDRFLLATVAYQGHAGGLDPQRLWQVGDVATGGVLPELTLVLDLPVSVARARLARPADRMESRDDDYFERVRQGFLAEASRSPDRIRVIDADRAPEAVHADVIQEVSRVLETGPRA